jgi:hypothetical protein
MSKRPKQTARPFRTIAIVAIVAWGLYACWATQRVQFTGERLRDSLKASWPADGPPQLGTREKLLETADELASGRAWTFGDALAPVPAPTDDQRLTATKFLSEHSQLRDRLLALTGTARDMAATGDDVTALREALARAYHGAVEADETTVTAQLDLAERMLALAESGSVGPRGHVDEQAVAQLVAAIEPAYQLSQDLMTEGGAAAEKVLIEAARSHCEQRYADAASALRLAGELLGAQLALPTEAVTPDWFTALAQREIPDADQSQATAAVQLAEAMALSMTPSDTVAALLKKARRELDAKRFGTSAWWASVTLNALGMSDSAIAAATTNSGEPAKESMDEEGAE